MSRFLHIGRISIFFIACSVSLCSTSEVYSQMFQRLTSPTQGLVSSGTYVTPSLVGCLSRCLSNERNTYATYDEGQRACVCGTQFSSSLPPPSASEHLYAQLQTTQCTLTTGFDIYMTSDNTQVCLMVGPDKIVYGDAVDMCSGITNARLFVSDTKEKLNALHELALSLGIATSADVWIGMDDKEQEDVFVWADGRKVTQAERDALFEPGKPDNSQGGQHCVSLHMSINEINDVDCSETHRYACEIPLGSG